MPDVPEGPVEYVIVGFSGNQFKGEIFPELAKLVDSGAIRILDLVFIGKDAGGNIVTLEADQVRDIPGLEAIDADVGGFISPEDLEHAAAGLEPNSSAALLIWEDAWAIPFVNALRNAGGVLIEGARVPADLVHEAMASVASAT